MSGELVTAVQAWAILTAALLLFAAVLSAAGRGIRAACRAWHRRKA